MSKILKKVKKLYKQIKEDKLEGNIWIYFDENKNVYLIDKLPKKYWIKDNILVVYDPKQYLEEIYERKPTSEELDEFYYLGRTNIPLGALVIKFNDIKNVSNEQNVNIEDIIYVLENIGFKKVGDIFYFQPKIFIYRYQNIDTDQEYYSLSELYFNTYEKLYIYHLNINIYQYISKISSEYRRKLDNVLRIIIPKPLEYDSNNLRIKIIDLFNLYVSMFGKLSFDKDFIDGILKINEFQDYMYGILNTEKMLKRFYDDLNSNF